MLSDPSTSPAAAAEAEPLLNLAGLSAKKQKTRGGKIAVAQGKLEKAQGKLAVEEKKRTELVQVTGYACSLDARTAKVTAAETKVENAGLEVMKLQKDLQDLIESERIKQQAAADKQEAAAVEAQTKKEISDGANRARCSSARSDRFASVAAS